MISYDPHSWWMPLLDARGTLVREILGRVSVAVGISVAVVALHERYPEAVSWLVIPETAHTLVGGAIALLLVFRTNSSYDRFWEGRKMWGAIVNETRNLVRQATVWCAGQPDLVRQIAVWTIAFPYSCKHRLRGERHLGPVSEVMLTDDVKFALSAQHIPLAVARRITTLLNGAREQQLIGEYQQMYLDQNVQLLIDYLGACERIHTTPMPYAYTVHLRRALFLYCFTLPLALVARFGWETVPATLILSYILFGIEEIGVEIEDPFGTDLNDLPLDDICANIERTLRDAASHVLAETPRITGTV